MADKKISELQSIPTGITGDDVGILVQQNTDYKFQFSDLLLYISAHVATGNKISFVTAIPANTAETSADIAINTTNGSYYQKLNGSWTTVYTPPTSIGNNTGATIQYGLGIPDAASGQLNDNYIDTASGKFYQKTASGWQQKFSMLNGPAGGPGPKGDAGTPGASGKTLLSGIVNPSNQSVGTDGDFYINTNTWTIFGPKTNSDWGTGKAMTQEIAGLGDLNTLSTADKSNLVAAINEVLSKTAAPAWTVYGTVPFGKYTNGQVVPNAISAYAQYKEAYQNASHPTYIQPSVIQPVSANITGTSTPQSNSTIEVGQIIDFTINPAFTAGDSGGLVSGPNPKPLSITRKIGTAAAVEIATTEPYTDPAVVLTNANIVYTSTYNYKQGLIRNNDAQVADPVGRIEADAKSASQTITPRYKIFYGTLPNDIQLTSDLVRGVAGQASVVNFIWENGSVPVSLSTGTTYQRFFIAIRNGIGRSLTIAKDVQTNGDVKSIYLDGKVTMTIKNGGAGDVNYDVYVYQQAVAYIEPHTHELTI